MNFSGAGWRADLYSAFGVQRNLGDLRQEIPLSAFSITGPRRDRAKIPAKCNGFGASASCLSGNNDLMAGRESFELSVQVVMRQ
jgi:hypothetical protein